MIFDECTAPGIDEHNYLSGWCQANYCGRTEAEYMHHGDTKTHDFQPPNEPLVWGENSSRLNVCPRSIPDEGYNEWTTCDCLCHWSQYYVNVYELSQGYGGPEEGGWWYMLGEPTASVPFDTYKEADEFRTLMEGRFPRTHKSSNTNYSGGDYSVSIEKRFAEHWPTETPRYE